LHFLERYTYEKRKDMAKIPAAQMRLKLEDLAKLLAAGYTDKEIMTSLKLKRRTFYYYKAKVCRIFGNIAEKNTEQVLEFEAEILKDRYIRLFRNLEQRATNRNTKLRDVANASEIAAMIATNIFRLEMEGFRARKTRRELKQGEQKANTYL
jgi:hypothetical protein